MRGKPRFFLVNKKSDFSRGYGGMTSGESLKVGSCYFSEVFDSGERETRWYKIETEFELPVNCSLQITFYSCETPEIEIGGKLCKISEMLNSRMPFTDKLHALKPLFCFSAPLSRELLLTEIKARYLFFSIQSVCPDNNFPVITKIRLSFDPFMWTNYLPEIYRSDNSFLERYLAIFQSLFEHTEEQIDRCAEYYSQDSSDGDFLRWTADCFGIKTAGLWNESQLKYILSNAPRIFGRVGTKEILSEMCGLYLGCKVDVIEYYQSEDASFADGFPIPAERIFTNPYEFALIVSCGPISEEKYGGLVKIVDDFKPAYMKANIIILPRDEQKGTNDSLVLDDKGITLV